MGLLAFSLFSVVWSVCFIISLIPVGIVSVALGTDSEWVFFLLGFPLSFILAVYWIIIKWDYVKAFVTGKRGW